MSVTSINHTEIVLISKCSNPTSLTKIWPISLCTVLYNIVAKGTTNRLQGVIGHCIDVAQCVFVPNRLILIMSS